MLGATEKRMYKVLRHVGVKKNFIVHAQRIEDLYLDEFDKMLLQYYFENEFKVVLKKREVKRLTDLKALKKFLCKK